MTSRIIPEHEFAERAAIILHNMALERRGWHPFRRWFINDEPLRNDAANLLRMSGWNFKMPDDCRLVGDE